MTEREQAISTWRLYCIRMGLHPEQVIGCTYPGHEKFRVDAAMAKEIVAWPLAPGPAL